MGALEPRPRRGPLVGPGGEGAAPDAGAFTLPNALTALRLALAPVFLVLYVTRRIEPALWVFAVAAATDVLDGLIARLLRQYSRLGSVLDPIADKLLAFCALVGLTAAGRLPLWLPALLVGRDAAQLAGAVTLQALDRSVPIRPTRAGKYATFLLAVLVVLELSADVGVVGPTPAHRWGAAVALLAATCVALSFAQYGAVFVAALRGPRAAARGR